MDSNIGSHVLLVLFFFPSPEFAVTASMLLFLFVAILLSAGHVV